MYETETGGEMQETVILFNAEQDVFEEYNNEKYRSFERSIK